MNTNILAVLLFVLEMLKYCIGNKLLFNGKIREIKSIVFFAIFYCIIIILGGCSLEDMYLISYAAAGLLCYFVFEGKWKEKIFKIPSILTVTMCMDELIGIFLYLSCYKEISFEIKVIIESLGTAAIFYMLVLLKNKCKEPVSKKDELMGIRKSIIVICLILCLGFIAGGLLYIQKYIVDETMKIVYYTISLFTYICIIIVVIDILLMKSANERMRKLVETERALKQMSENYYSALLRKEDETRKYRHDMNNHILCLKEYARKESAKDTLQYIEILQEKLDSIQKKVYFTGNDILDILLNYYLQFLDNTEITVTGICKCKLNMNDVDFCIVISNLLQNAVEEIFRLKNENKYINIKIEQGKSFFKLEIRNSSNAIFNKNNKTPITQKEDKKNHGIGLNNIIETVERNHGKFEIEGNGREVCATIILSLEITI